MINVNQILIQLNKAIECANSVLPQEKAISVILFDNLIEVYLYKKLESAFMRDNATWHGGQRSYNAEIRNEVNRYYLQLLKVSKSNKVISEPDFYLLKYLHEIRNSVYHKGNLNLQFIEIAISLYKDFLVRNVQNWGSPVGLICISDSPGYKKINFGQNNSIHTNVLDPKYYFKGASEYLLGNLRCNNSIDILAIDILTNKLEKIAIWKNQIESESKEINFYEILNRYWYLNSEFYKFYISKRKPKNLNSILILYKYLRENKDLLDDIDDLKKRQSEGKKRLQKLRTNLKGEYPHWIKIEKIETRINKLKNKPSNIVIQNFMSIESEISYLFSDLSEACSDLTGFIQQLIDIARDK